MGRSTIAWCCLGGVAALVLLVGALADRGGHSGLQAAVGAIAALLALVGVWHVLEDC